MQRELGCALCYSYEHPVEGEGGRREERGRERREERGREGREGGESKGEGIKKKRLEYGSNEMSM